MQISVNQEAKKASFGIPFNFIAKFPHTYMYTHTDKLAQCFHFHFCTLHSFESPGSQFSFYENLRYIKVFNFTNHFSRCSTNAYFATLVSFVKAAFLSRVLLEICLFIYLFPQCKVSLQSFRPTSTYINFHMQNFNNN